MNADDSPSIRAIGDVSSLLNYEVLISRPGITEPDTDFIWASTFMAPLGLSFVREDMYFNLFLPEGSENDGNKNLFLKRVGAKLQDGLWQVRRRMDEVTGNYGEPMRRALTLFRTLMIDHAYINNGRAHVHFRFNDADLPGISRMLLGVSNDLSDMRVEYLRKSSGEIASLGSLGPDAEISAVTIEASPMHGNPDQKLNSGGLSFVLASLVTDGVKGSGIINGEGFPPVLDPADLEEIGDGLVAFRARNPFLVSLVERIASEYVVVYGYFGSVKDGSISLTISVPYRQISALLRVLNSVIGEQEGWNLKLKEVTSLGVTVK